MKTDPNTRNAIKMDPTRHWDDTFRLMSWWDADKVANAQVMVVGAGALGNEVLKNLALLNVGRLLIVDFDTVEYANLCRSILFRPSDCDGQQYKCEVAARRIREINPNVKVATIAGNIISDVGLGVFRQADVIIGCLDNRLARLFINRYAHTVGKTWVDGAIENLSGDLDVYRPGTSCYECELSEVENRMIRYRLGCPDIAMRNISFGKVATTPISASIIGAMQAQEALKVIYKNEEQSLAGQHFRYEGMNFATLLYPKQERQEDCSSHQPIESLIEAPELSCKNTVGELLQWAATRWKEANPVLHLGYQLVEELTGKESEISHEVLLSVWHLTDKIYAQYQRVEGESLGITRDVTRLDRSFAHPDATLEQIGIPPLQILKLEAAGALHFVELSGDHNFLEFS